MLRYESKNKHKIDMCVRKFGLHTPNELIILCGAINIKRAPGRGGEDLNDHFKEE